MLAQHRDEKRRGVDLYRARYGSRFDFVEEFTRCDLLESREVVKQAVNTRPPPGAATRQQGSRSDPQNTPVSPAQGPKSPAVTARWNMCKQTALCTRRVTHGSGRDRNTNQ